MFIRVTIKGESPLLVCRFTEADAEQVSRSSSSTMQTRSRDTPRNQAAPKLYLDSQGRVIFPGPNIFRAIVDAGRFVKRGKMQVTTSKTSLVPAGIVLPEIECPIVTPDGNEAKWEVDSRSAVIPATGGRIMAYRPRFDSWCLSFSLVVDEEMFGEPLVRQLVDDAGGKIGVGAYRPARKGPFGRFKVTTWEISPKTSSAIA